MTPSLPELVSLPKQWEVSSKQSQIMVTAGRTGGKGQAASEGLQQDYERSFWSCLRHLNLEGDGTSGWEVT